MTDDYNAMIENEAPFPPLEEEPKKGNKVIWFIVIVLVVLCCCCAVFGGAGTWLWYNGDALLEEFGVWLPHLLA